MPQSQKLPNPAPREAKLFRNNKSQAIRIPVDLELPGDRVLIHKDGDRLIIEPARRKSLVDILAVLQPLGPDDQFPEIDATLLPERDIDLLSRRYMFDTNIVSELARNPQGTVAQRIAKVGSDAICISIITAAELRYGCAKKGSSRLLAQIEAILGGLEVLPLDVPSDDVYGKIRAGLESAGRPIGPNDLLIAAHALAVGAALVSANTGEFTRVPELQLENWLTD